MSISSQGGGAGIGGGVTFGSLAGDLLKARVLSFCLNISIWVTKLKCTNQI